MAHCASFSRFTPPAALGHSVTLRFGSRALAAAAAAAAVCCLWRWSNLISLFLRPQVAEPSHVVGRRYSPCFARVRRICGIRVSLVVVGPHCSHCSHSSSTRPTRLLRAVAPARGREGTKVCEHSSGQNVREFVLWLLRLLLLLLFAFFFFFFRSLCLAIGTLHSKDISERVSAHTHKASGASESASLTPSACIRLYRPSECTHAK